MWNDTTESPDSYSKSSLLDMKFCNSLSILIKTLTDKAFRVLFHTFDQLKMWWGE